MGAFAALFRGGPVTLGCSFMMVRSSCVCIFWHQDGVSGVYLLLYCTRVPSTVRHPEIASRWKPDYALSAETLRHSAFHAARLADVETVSCI